MAIVRHWRPHWPCFLLRRSSSPSARLCSRTQHPGELVVPTKGGLQPAWGCETPAACPEHRLELHAAAPDARWASRATPAADGCSRSSISLHAGVSHVRTYRQTIPVGHGKASRYSVTRRWNPRRSPELRRHRIAWTEKRCEAVNLLNYASALFVIHLGTS